MAVPINQRQERQGHEERQATLFVFLAFFASLAPGFFLSLAEALDLRRQRRLIHLREVVE
jgi:hypothetical protein